MMQQLNMANVMLGYPPMLVPPAGSREVPNSAGGLAFPVSDMTRLQRFLCLGVEGGTYYIGEKPLALEHAAALQRLLQAGRGADVVAEVVRWSEGGRAAKQNPVVFALAVCARLGDAATKQAAYAALPRVCRIPTHLFLFVGYCEHLGRTAGATTAPAADAPDAPDAAAAVDAPDAPAGEAAPRVRGGGTGWGRAHKRAVAAWFNGGAGSPHTSGADLAMHVTKYRNRGGWSPADVLRLCHATPADAAHGLVFRYVAKGYAAVAELTPEQAADPAVVAAWRYLTAVHAASALKTVDAAGANAAALAALIREHHLVWEHVPTPLLNSRVVWEALLDSMPLMAMVRNLGKMTAIGLLLPGSAAAARVVAKLGDGETLRRARVHPFALLLALRTYEQGCGERGSLAWQPVPAIVAALDAAFYAAFAQVVPTGKRFVLGIDVSGSMTGKIAGSPLSAREAATALALVTLRTETQVVTMAFQDAFVPLPLTRDMSLAAALRASAGLSFGSTDCAQPMLWAAQHGVAADVFVVMTDSETWCGNVSAADALRRYRAVSGVPDAKLVVAAFASNGFSIADPDDAGMLDIVGLDPQVPELLRSFASGAIGA